MKIKFFVLITALAAFFAPVVTASTTTVQPGAAPTPPTQASAVGFTNLVFDDEFTTNTTFTTSTSATSGYNWYFYPWGPLTASAVTINTGAGTGALAGATGIATVNGGVCIQTVPTYPANANVIPGTYQHAYFEARCQFSPTVTGSGGPAGGWPSFWSFGISAFAGTATGYTSENDFFEAYPNGNAGSTSDCINTLHNWEHSATGVCGTDTDDTNSDNQSLTLVGSSESGQPDDGAWHTYGCLWVQTSATAGYIEYYLDNYLVVHQNGVTRFLTGTNQSLASGVISNGVMGTSLTNQEVDHMFLIIGSGDGWPMNVDWVHVWQSGTTTGTTTGTAAQTVSGFPSTLSLFTTASPYTLPASTSAGLTLSYSVSSGPATVSGNTLTITGAGTIVVKASQAGSATYAAYSGTETITTTAPTATQTVSGFPATLNLSTTQSPYTLPASTSANLAITYSVTSGPATVSGDALKLTGAGTVVLKATQQGNSSYAAYSGTETMTVTAPATQTISSFPATLSLSTTQSPYTLPASTSAGLAITYSVTSGPATVSTNTLTITGAGTVVVKATQAGNATYGAYSGTETITVKAPTAATQTVSDFPSTLSMTTSASPYDLPSTTSAGLTLSYSVTSGPATVSGHILTITGKGTIVLKATQAGNSSYAAYSGTETITVTAAATAAQTVSGLSSTLSLSTTASPYSLPATTSAGLTLSYSVTSGPATVSGHTLTITGAGTVVVHATQAGNATYSAFSQTETITVTAPPATQTVSNFPSTQTLTLGTSAETLPATTSAGLTITYSVVSGPATISGDKLTVTGTGTVIIRATQAGNGSNASFSETETITVTSPTSLTFAQWEAQAGYFTSAEMANADISGPTATPENDGVPNLLKYLYDINPAVPMTPADYAALPASDVDTTTTPGTTYLTLTYRRYTLVTGITVNVQTSSDLQTWTTVTPNISQKIETDPNTGDPIMEVEVNTEGAPREFIRLYVTSP